MIRMSVMILFNNLQESIVFMVGAVSPVKAISLNFIREEIKNI